MYTVPTCSQEFQRAPYEIVSLKPDGLGDVMLIWILGCHVRLFEVTSGWRVFFPPPRDLVLDSN